MGEVALGERNIPFHHQIGNLPKVLPKYEIVAGILDPQGRMMPARAQRAVVNILNVLGIAFPPNGARAWFIQSVHVMTAMAATILTLTLTFDDGTQAVLNFDCAAINNWNLNIHCENCVAVLSAVGAGGEVAITGSW